MVGADDVGLDRFDRIVLVVERAGRAGEVIDLVGLEDDRLHDVVAEEFESAALDQLLVTGAKVLPPAGEVVVQADNVTPFVEKAQAKMGPDKPRAAGYQTDFPGHR